MAPATRTYRMPITDLRGCPFPVLARLGRTLRTWRPEFLSRRGERHRAFRPRPKTGHLNPRLGQSKSATSA